MRLRRSWSRREVVWCLAGLALIQLALAAVLEWPRPDLRDPEYGHKLRALRERLAEGSDRSLVLVTGSSRVLNGLRAGDLDGAGRLVFNFGLTRHGPVKQLLCLNRLFSDGVRPRAAVVEIAPPLLPLGGVGVEAVPVEQQKWTDLALLREYDPEPAALYARWFEGRAVPSYTSRYVLLSRLAPAFVPWAHREDHFWRHTDRAGWLAIPEAGTEAEARADTEKVRQGHGQVMRTQFTVSPVSARATRGALRLLRERAVPAAVLLMPESAEFRGWYGPGAEDQLQAFLARLRAEFGVPVIDARAWVSDDGLFRDGHHLLPEGARQFTERFGREALPLLGAGTPGPLPVP
jgi:hypothetical protein